MGNQRASRARRARRAWRGMAGSVAALVAAGVLGGCAMHHGERGEHHEHHRRSMGLQQHLQPQVSVKGGVISVSPEPLVYLKDEGAVSIVWHAPKGYTFPSDGIVVEGQLVDAKTGEPLRPTQTMRPPADRIRLDSKQQQIVDCKVDGEGQRFSCRNRNSGFGWFKYSIRLLHDGKPVGPVDPEIMNVD
jgi:hypothetical protein